VSWRDHLRVHPAAKLFPPMSESELRELGEDIKNNGLLEEPVLYRDQELGICVLDGRNRLDACELIGRETIDASGGPKVGTIRHASRSFDPFAFVISKNIRRRHLSVEQRQELLITLIARQPERSDRQIAKMAGVDHKTIAAARTKGEDVGSIPHVETRTDSSGRKQPATKTKTTKPKPVNHRVTESPEISLEQRRAENADLDLSAEERAAKASPDDRKNHGGAARRQEPSDDAESDDVADPATVEEGVMHTLMRMNAHARMFKKVFKLSSFDREAEVRISTAIDRMIQKWRSTHATLTNERRRAGADYIVEQCLSLIMAMTNEQRSQFFAKYTELMAERASPARAAQPIRTPPVRQN
jgi:hypothetical protein